MLVQIYILSTLCLIASTVAVPLSFEYFNEVNALNFDQVKNIPENVVEDKKKYYEDKKKDVEKPNTLEVLDSFVENSKKKESKQPENNKVDKYNDRVFEDSKEIKEEYKEKEESKKEEKVEEKADFQVFLGSFAENSEIKDSKEKYDEIENDRYPGQGEEKTKVNKHKEKYEQKDEKNPDFQVFLGSFAENSEVKSSKEKFDEIDNDRFQGANEGKNKVNKDKEKYEGKDEENPDFQVFLGSFAENSEVKESKEKYDEINNDRFQGESEEKNKVYENKDVGNHKEKDVEKPDYQVFWDPFSKKSKRKKSKKEKKGKKVKKEKKNKRNKHVDRFIPPGSEYSYYRIDVDFKKDKVKVYPDMMLDDYALEWWPEPSYGYPSVFDYLMALYYPPRSYWPFKFQPKYRRPKIAHKKRTVLL